MGNILNLAPGLGSVRQHYCAAYVGMVVVVVYGNTTEKAC